MEGVMEWVRTIVVYVILISVVLHLLPDKQYSKYVQLFLGLLLILITMGPIMKLFGKENPLELFYEQAFYTQEAQEEELLEQIKEQAGQGTLQAFENQICNQLEQWLRSKGYQARQLEVELDTRGIQRIEAQLMMLEEPTTEEKVAQDYQTQTSGKASKDDQTQTSGKVTQDEQTQITGKATKDDLNKIYESTKWTEEQLREEISKTYEISKNRIHISIK